MAFYIMNCVIGISVEVFLYKQCSNKKWNVRERKRCQENIMQ